MKKIILITSLIILSVALLYGSFKVFYEFNELDINYYYWSKSYKDGSRDYFLTTKQTLFNEGGRGKIPLHNEYTSPFYNEIINLKKKETGGFSFIDFDFQNSKKEGIYFGLFNYLITEKKDTIKISGKDSYLKSNESINIETFTGEAIKLRELEIKDEDLDKYLNPNYLSYGLNHKDTVGLYTKLKSFRLNPSLFENRNIKCRQVFKKGKPHGVKIIYPDLPFWIENIDVLDKKSSGSDAKIVNKMPVFRVNINAYVHENKKKSNFHYPFVFKTDSIVEIYDEGKLIECIVWSANTEIRHLTKDKKGIELFTYSKLNLSIENDKVSLLNLNYDKYAKILRRGPNKKCRYYQRGFYKSDYDLSYIFKIEKPKLIYEKNNKNGIMNLNQVNYKVDQIRIDNVVNNFLISLISFLLIESLIIFLFVMRIKKLNN